MAAYTKQTWDTTSIFNPTRMNHIEQGIYDASTNIADNLTTNDGTKALSAKQGKVLNERMYSKVITATTDSNGNINSDLLASQYIYIGTKAVDSRFYLPLNALSDGKIRIRVLDSVNMNPVVGADINQTFYFWKLI